MSRKTGNNYSGPRWTFSAGRADHPTKSTPSGSGSYRSSEGGSKTFKTCEACGQPMRYSTAYDEPHWVHINITDTLTCPMYASTR